MAVEADVVAYLDAALVALIAGTNLYEGPMPEFPDTCVAVAHYASQRSDDYVMGASLTAPGYEVEFFQVMTRDADKATARTQANAIHALLDNFAGTMNARAYFHVRSDGTPTDLGQDQTLRWRYVANYEAQKVRG